MKKFVKLLGILLLLGAMLLSLGGCKELDDMRAHQLFPEADGSFLRDGVRYVRLEANGYFRPANRLSSTYYLTNPDVPVLLSQQFTIGYLSFTQDGRFVENQRDGSWYCREDLFEEIQAKNRQPFVPETLFYTCYAFNEELGEPQETIYTLSDAEVAAIGEVTAGQPLELADGMYLSTDWEVSLTGATRDLLFRDYDGPCIQKAGDALYISTYDQEGVTTYQVPEKHKALLEAAAKLYVDTYYFSEYVG